VLETETELLAPTWSSRICISWREQILKGKLLWRDGCRPRRCSVQSDFRDTPCNKDPYRLWRHALCLRNTTVASSVHIWTKLRDLCEYNYSLCINRLSIISCYRLRLISLDRSIYRSNLYNSYNMLYLYITFKRNLMRNGNT